MTYPLLCRVGRSSLYYWAQYDFFNNSLSGDRVAGTACDELVPSWRASRGTLRSPTNTLVYRGVGPGGVASVSQAAVRCTYRFVTDPRLYARVEVSVHRIHFRVSAVRGRHLGSRGLALVLTPGRRLCRTTLSHCLLKLKKCTSEGLRLLFPEMQRQAPIVIRHAGIPLSYAAPSASFLTCKCQLPQLTYAWAVPKAVPMQRQPPPRSVRCKHGLVVLFSAHGSRPRCHS